MGTLGTAGLGTAGDRMVETWRGDKEMGTWEQGGGDTGDTAGLDPSAVLLVLPAGVSANQSAPFRSRLGGLVAQSGFSEALTLRGALIGAN